VLAAYESALGGQAAARKVSSLHMRGTVEIVNAAAPGVVEVFAKAPGNRAVTYTIERIGTLRTVFDGQSGWTQVPGGPVESAQGAVLDSLRRNADVMRDFRLRALFKGLALDGKTTTNGREAHVLVATPQSGKPERWHFDAQTGLLLRIEGWTVEGLPSEINFEDYRDVSGVKYPFVTREFTPVYQMLTRIEKVEVNVPVDDSAFTVRQQ
jgi:outer membrane lipoprotein-sorting protein